MRRRRRAGVCWHPDPGRYGAAVLQQGYRTEAILEAFPDLSLADVEEARRYW
jgi:hypothetical protein